MFFTFLFWIYLSPFFRGIFPVFIMPFVFFKRSFYFSVEDPLALLRNLPEEHSLGSRHQFFFLSFLTEFVLVSFLRYLSCQHFFKLSSNTFIRCCEVFIFGRLSADFILLIFKHFRWKFYLLTFFIVSL